MLTKLGLYFVMPILLLIVSFKSVVYLNTKEAMKQVWDKNQMNTTNEVARLYEKDGLHRGMSVFGWHESKENSIDELVRANIEWVAVIPFIYQENENSNQVRTPRDNFTRRDSLFLNTITALRNKGLYVHLKPHLWLGDGWRSNLKLDSKAEWDEWFASYRDEMLRYAKIAQITGTELFCVGTELRTSIKAQPEAWAKLIFEIREVYDGKLTYAANWYDEYEHVTFWDQLDYIGIQAYFPLTKTKNPELETIKKGWAPHISTLEAFSKKHELPILFTEVGYKSEASATIKPWEWGSMLGVLYKKKSDRTQQLAYEALFQELWHRKWFAGVYIWQWDTRTSEKNAATNLDFSPRFKVAENSIAKWFGKSN